MRTIIKRIFKSGFINFWRNGVVSIASILVMTVTLFVIGSLVLAAAFLSASLTEVQSKVDISVSFKVDASLEEIKALQRDLMVLPEVKEVALSTREEELTLFRERHKDNNLLLQSLDEVCNPFGARLNIKAVNPTQYESIATFLTNQDSDSAAIIDQVSFKKDVVDKLLAITNSLRRVGLAVSIVLIITSILVMFNTTSLAIYIAREEISVMRLVGAETSYVRGPFMVEAIISGLIASLVAMLLLYPAVLWVRNATLGVYGGINLLSYYLSNFFYLFLMLLTAGVTLGAVASFLAIRKYMKV